MCGQDLVFGCGVRLDGVRVGFFVCAWRVCACCCCQLARLGCRLELRTSAGVENVNLKIGGVFLALLGAKAAAGVMQAELP